MFGLRLRDIAMICFGALLMFLFFEFGSASPLNELRDAYSTLLTK